MRGIYRAYTPRYGGVWSVCCEDLLRGATGCCSPVAGELVLCSTSLESPCIATQDKAHWTGTGLLFQHAPTPSGPEPSAYSASFREGLLLGKTRMHTPA